MSCQVFYGLLENKRAVSLAEVYAFQIRSLCNIQARRGFGESGRT